MAFNTVKRNVCGDRYKHCHVTEFSYPVSSCPPTLTDGLQVCRKFWFFLKVTQDLRLNHGDGSVTEATYKRGVISESMETDIIEKHSYAGHDCANPKSLYTKNAPRFTVLNSTLRCCERRDWGRGSCRSLCFLTGCFPAGNPILNKGTLS